VRLTAAHRLGEPEHPLGGFPLESAERLSKQGCHPVRQVVLLKKFVGIDTVLDEIADV
jgi:hypothetical protein